MSIPGERIGYIAMESCVQDYEDLIAGMTASMRYLGYVNAPSLQQKMLLKCVDASVDISIYQETRDILYHALTEIGYTCIHPDGACLLYTSPCLTYSIACRMVFRLAFMSSRFRNKQ